MDVRRILLCLAVVSVSQAYYIFLSSEDGFQFGQAKGLCESHGMTLPILPTENDYNQFLNISRQMYISFYGAAAKTKTWIGLKLVGTDVSDPSSYTWINGQTATYIDENMSTDDPEKICVRIFDRRMRRVTCQSKRSTFCQGDPQNRTELAPMFYNVNNNISSFGPTDASLYYTVVSNEFQLPASIDFCSLEHSRTSLVHCFLVCLQRLSCRVVMVLRDLSSCYIQC